eukprot:gene6921-14060_t
MWTKYPRKVSTHISPDVSIFTSINLCPSLISKYPMLVPPYTKYGGTSMRYFGTDKDGRRFVEVKIDRSGLIRDMRNEPIEQSSSSVRATTTVRDKEPLTSLGNDLLSYIQMRGPLTLHEFIAQASNNQRHGYYQHDEDKIGKKGDFVTSPEISQLFGEMICVWFVSLWQSIGSPSSINLVELGPGNGTLMADMLRTASRFPEFKNSVQAHMVEMSTSLQRKQAVTLGCVMNSEAEDIIKKEGNEGNGTTETSFASGVTRDGFKVQWHKFIRTLPPGPVLLVAQEFLDAFPVHQFVKVNSKPDGWREVLVDEDTAESTSPLHFRLVLSPQPTPAVRILLRKYMPESPSPSSSSSATPDLLLPDGVKHAPVVFTDTLSSEDPPPDGMEISPLSQAVMEDITQRVMEHGGGALIVDYGEYHSQTDTLRGFKKHQQTHPLSSPGEVDVTADVDFKAMADVVREAGGSVLGPVTQGEFLVQMGIVQRVEQLLGKESTTVEQGEQLVDALHMIAGNREGSNDMGVRYKVLGIVNRKQLEDQNKSPENIPGFAHQDAIVR